MKLAIRSGPSTPHLYELWKVCGDWVLYRKLMLHSEHSHAGKLKGWALPRGRGLKVQFRALQKIALPSLGLVGDRKEHRE